MTDICSDVQLFLLTERNRFLTEQYRLKNEILAAIQAITEGREVNESMMSVPLVRTVWEMIQNEKGKDNAAHSEG